MRYAADPAPWTSIDWNDVAERAQASGDAQGAVDALEIRDRLARGGNVPLGEQKNVLVSLGKKVILQVLKHAVSKLPAKIRPYVHKIIGVVEEIDSFQQTVVVGALTRAGIPYDVSVATAQWIVFFLGL